MRRNKTYIFKNKEGRRNSKKKRRQEKEQRKTLKILVPLRLHALQNKKKRADNRSARTISSSAWVYTATMKHFDSFAFLRTQCHSYWWKISRHRLIKAAWNLVLFGFGQTKDLPSLAFLGQSHQLAVAWCDTTTSYAQHPQQLPLYISSSLTPLLHKQACLWFTRD